MATDGLQTIARAKAAACGAAGLLAVLVAAPAQARPVGYAGGWLVNADDSLGGPTAEVLYSPSSRFAVGVRTEHDAPLQHDFAGAALNVLAYRLNAPDSQANLYLMGAVGGATGGYVVPTIFTGPLSIHAAHIAALGGKAGPVLRFNEGAGEIGGEADWESRRFSALAEARGMAIQRQGSTLMYRARFGVAPYIAEAGALHTWLVLQVEHHSFAKENLAVTPLVRLFKGPALVEVGSTLRGRPFATLWLVF